ncbi:MAG TPA: class I SAM-dependent methyltransferase [Verrucomicrobiae bacterium]|nr:class I SAM-dependent methyltransferase [Verrucomicrobiae bacterium]
MSEFFDVNQYWLKRGRGYIGEPLPQEYHRLQEKFLLDLLRASRMPMDRILEIGCGFGRVTKLLTEHFPAAQITALDLSPDQLANAQRYCGQPRNVVFEQYDFYSGLPFPGTGYDAAVAIEVFLHHPRQVVHALIERLAGVAGCIVNIDWSEDWPWKTAEHVWVHDYAAIYQEAGLQCAGFALPRKVDGMQQMLFIAASHLPGEVARLEQEAHAAMRDALMRSPPPAASEPGQWPQQLQRAVQEIMETVPAGSSLILVNDDQWDNEASLIGRRVVPFMERDGRYWGRPENDEMALRELERLRRAGAGYVVVGWNCFWWLEHYPRWHRHLRDAFPCVLENERLILFKLT